MRGLAYLLVFAICFAISGILFALTIFLQNKVVKKDSFSQFTMPMAALIPAVVTVLIFDKAPFDFASLGNWKLWLIALATAMVAALIVQLKKKRAGKDSPLGRQCLEAASMEIVQRVFMQTLAWGLLQTFGLQGVACIPINACVFVADIFFESIFDRERNVKNTLVEALASFAFSMGIGYVFYASGCFVIPMLAHAAERVLSKFGKDGRNGFIQK